jgi:hypothetical protein
MPLAPAFQVQAAAFLLLSSAEMGGKQVNSGKCFKRRRQDRAGLRGTQGEERG